MEEKHIYTTNDRVTIGEHFNRTVDKAGEDGDLDLIVLYNDSEETVCIAKNKNEANKGFKIKKKHTNMGYGDGVISELVIEKINLSLL